MSNVVVLQIKASLQDLARQIESHANKADERTLAAALLVRQARARIEAGEAGIGVKWFEWALKNIQLSKSRLSELQSIAQADNPQAEMERRRQMTNDRQKRKRERDVQAARMQEPVRKQMSAWLKDAPCEMIEKYWRSIQSDIHARELRVVARLVRDDAADAA